MTYFLSASVRITGQHETAVIQSRHQEILVQENDGGVFDHGFRGEETLTAPTSGRQAVTHLCQDWDEARSGTGFTAFTHLQT